MDALTVLNGLSSWLVELTGPNETSRLSQGVKLDVFATSMRVTKQIPGNLQELVTSGTLTGSDVTQRITDLVPTGLVERSDTGCVITELGRAVLARWQELGVDNEDADRELVRQAVLVDEGIRNGPPVYARARDFWSELVTLHPAEQWFANPLALYLVSYLNSSDSHGYNPWLLVRAGGASMVDLTDAQWDQWADTTDVPPGWTKKTGVKLLDAAKSAATRYVGRVNFCMALEARRRSLLGESIPLITANWVVPHA